VGRAVASLQEVMEDLGHTVQPGLAGRSGA
jgi:hypothetical protein